MRRYLAPILVVACLTACGAPKTFDQAARRVIVASAAAERDAPKTPPRARQPRSVAAHRFLVAYWWSVFFADVQAQATVTPWGAPDPISGATCPPGFVHDEIDRVFGIAAPWFQSIAWRESNCQPGAYNASGASGIGQLLGHEDIVAAVCPGDPYQLRFDARCNIAASFVLFKGSGTSPWRL